jgi:hypothetical protein
VAAGAALENRGVVAVLNLAGGLIRKPEGRPIEANKTRETSAASTIDPAGRMRDTGKAH